MTTHFVYALKILMVMKGSVIALRSLFAPKNRDNNEGVYDAAEDAAEEVYEALKIL